MTETKPTERKDWRSTAGTRSRKPTPEFNLNE